MTRARTIQAAVLALSAAAGAVGEPFDLILPDLTTERVDVQALSDRSIAFEDERGRQRTLNLSGAVAIVAPGGGDASPVAARGWATLVDGQRFVGGPADLASDADALAWRHPHLGAMWFPLDRLSEARFAPVDEIPSDAPEATIDDVVLLRNGDARTGFVLAIEREITVEPSPGHTFTIPRDLVSAVRLANEPAPLEGMVFWLDDGSVVRADETLDSGVGPSVEIRVGDASALRPLSSIAAVVFDASRLTPLSSLEPASQAAVGERRWAEPLRVLPDPHDRRRSPLDVRDVELPGPMRVTWDLPDGATRFAADVSMSPEQFPWGDCEFVLEVDGREAARVRLNESNPEASINAAVRGREMTVAVEPGAYGPVQDRVTLRRPMLLLGP